MALNPLVSLFGRLVARSGRKRGNRLRKPIGAIPHSQLDCLRETACLELRAREIAGSVKLQSVVTAHSSRSS